MEEILRGLAAAAEPAPVEAPEAPTLESVRADTADVEALRRDLDAVATLSGELPAMVQAMIAEIEGPLARLDLSGQGRRMMETLATGIRSGTAAVVAAVEAMTAQVCAALPNTPSVSMSVGGDVQARASGGRYGPGRLLTGEQGPELRYASESGFIAHNQALRRLVALSGEAAENTRQAGEITFSSTAPIRPRSAGAGSVTIGDIHVHAAPGQDAEGIAREVMRRIERSARAARPAPLHDGGAYAD